MRSMTTLNSAASAIVIACAGVHAMTDITGFGLMGHGREMALGSGVTIEIVVDQVPLIEGALDAVRARRDSRPGCWRIVTLQNV